MISVQEAQELILAETKLYGNELVDLEKALGRVLGEDVMADRDYPPFNRAAMDGYAFRLADYEPTLPFKIVGELYAGYQWKLDIPFRQCLKIMTGAATPLGLDCLVQVELAQVNLAYKEVLFPEITPKAWQNIAQKGEDCLSNSPILEKSTLLSPLEIATLAVLGKDKVSLRRLPKVAILSTGDELVPVGVPVSPFQIRDSNAFALQAFFNSLHIPISKKEIVKDDPISLKNAVGEVLDFDIVILSGGVSMGDADYVPKTLLDLGVTQVFHKVKLKPGKPLWFGTSPSGGAVFGLPGNPLSCQVCFKLFIEPYVRKCFGQPPVIFESYPLGVTRKKKVKLDEFFPVTLSQGILSPISFHGSGDVTSTLGSTGIALHPAEKDDIMANETISYLSWSY